MVRSGWRRRLGRGRSDGVQGLYSQSGQSGTVRPQKRPQAHGHAARFWPSLAGTKGRRTSPASRFGPGRRLVPVTGIPCPEAAGVSGSGRMAVDRVERRSGREGADIFDLPTVRLRGRNVLALVLAPEFPMSDWFAAFDRQLNAAPGFFEGRPIVADLRPALAEGGPQAIGLVLDTLALRDLK